MVKLIALRRGQLVSLFFSNLMYFVYLHSIVHTPPMQANRGVSNSAEKRKGTKKRKLKKNRYHFSAPSLVLSARIMG